MNIGFQQPGGRESRVYTLTLAREEIRELLDMNRRLVSPVTKFGQVFRLCPGSVTSEGFEFDFESKEGYCAFFGGYVSLDDAVQSLNGRRMPIIEESRAGGIFGQESMGFVELAVSDD